MTPSAGRCVRGDPDRDFPLLPLKQGFWTRWKAALDATNFGDAAEVQRLYEFALSELPADRFPDSEANRRNVFAQATKEVRMNAGGRFIRENVPRLRWFAANEDYDRAAQMITTLDARAEVVDQLPRPPRTPTEARRRDDEIIRLQHALREFVHDKTTEEITEAFELPEHVAAALLEWRTWSHVRNDDLRHLTLRIIAAQVGVTAGAQ